MKRAWFLWMGSGIVLELYALQRKKLPLTHVIKSLPGDRSRRMIIAVFLLYLFGHWVLEEF